MCDCGLGRVGSFGGVSSPEPKLLGGLLNGEFSCEISPLRATVGPEIEPILGAGISVLSFRGAGGGGGTLARLISPDRLGGGGDGGREPPGRGDFGALKDGEVFNDRLGILKDWPLVIGVAGDATASGFTNEG
jgi:hypothetical protein